MESTGFREFRVHHSSPEGVLLQLPGNSGFGRLTKETLGGDVLAERLLKSFAAREQVPVVLRRARDAEGYKLACVNLREAWSDILTFPQQVRLLVPQLLRKHLLVGLGTTTVARLVKSSAKGSVLTIAPNMTAVATLEKIDDTAYGSAPSSVEVRLLNYDVENNVVNVTARTEVVEATPTDTSVVAQALSTVRAGTIVKARVLFSCTDDGCAVVEVPVHCANSAMQANISLLGYYAYKWGETQAAEAPVVGSELELIVEFAAEIPGLQQLLPFIVLSNRNQTFAALPLVRLAVTPAPSTSSSSVGGTSSGAGSSCNTNCAGLVGFLPWRHTGKDAEGDSDDEAADEGGDAGEPRVRRRKLEEAIDAYERNMDTAIPTSPDEFKRLLLANPNSSFLWTQYMAHHAGLQQYEEARQVAEKALSVIGVREEQERLNVWVAYMNVENLYGTAESLASVFRRALRQQMDPLLVHERLADIFQASRKPNQLLALCRTMTNKFRDQRRSWERLGIVLADQDKRDQLKRMLKDMGNALKGPEASLAVVYIAIHEYKHGSIENGRALFEGLLAKTSKKSDVWGTFLDQEMSLLNRRAPESSPTQVRNIFERAVAMSFSAKVMQQLLTRFLAFEKAFGSPADVEKVKERARIYVESKIQSVTDAGSAGGAQ